MLLLNFFESFKISMIISKLGLFDFLMLIFLTLGIINGFVRGFLNQLPRILALFIAIIISMHFYQKISEIIAANTHIPSVIVAFAAFIALFLLTTGLSRFCFVLIAKLGTAECEYFLERVGGGVLGGIRFLILFCVLTFFINILSIPYINKMVQENSLTGSIALEVCPRIYQVSTIMAKAVFTGVEKVAQE